MKTESIEQRRARLGFNTAKAVGLNIIKMEAGETKFLKITSDFMKFPKKDGTELTYLEVIDLETGEEGNVWAGGQMVYQLKTMKDGFIGGSFQVTYSGLVTVDNDEFHQYDIKAVN